LNRVSRNPSVKRLAGTVRFGFHAEHILLLKSPLFLFLNAKEVIHK